MHWSFQCIQINHFKSATHMRKAAKYMYSTWRMLIASFYYSIAQMMEVRWCYFNLTRQTSERSFDGAQVFVGTFCTIKISLIHVNCYRRHCCRRLINHDCRTNLVCICSNKLRCAMLPQQTINSVNWFLFCIFIFI